MKTSSRQNFLAIVALAILGPLSVQAGSGLSSSAQHRLPSHSAFAAFNRILFPDSTYMIDDGTSEYAVGLSAGGDLICLNEFAVIPGAEIITSVSIAWGAPMSFDPTLNGLPYTAVLWSDRNGDGNPTDAAVLATASGVISNQGTDTFITTNFPFTTVTTQNFFVGFFISHGAGQYPAAFDETAPTFSNRSYVAGGANGDFYNLNDNDLPVGTIEFYGLPGNWLSAPTASPAAG